VQVVNLRPIVNRPTVALNIEIPAVGNPRQTATHSAGRFHSMSRTRKAPAARNESDRLPVSGIGRRAETVP